MKNKLTILVANGPEPVNGVTWWRMYRPLALMARAYPYLDIRWNRGHLLPSDFFGVDVLLVFRPENPEHPGIIAEARRWGCRVVVDMDDNTLNVPLGHPVFADLHGKAPYINHSVALANEVWVTTSHLRDALLKSNREFLSQLRRTQPKMDTVLGTPDIHVIPNAVLPSDLPDRANGNTNLGVWRGSNLHRDDLELWKSQYERIHRNVKTFHWVGYMPHWGNPSQRDGITYNMGVPVLEWFEYLRSLRPAFVWKPLVPNEFNQSKSNIAWLEATCAGAICISNFAGKFPGWEPCHTDLPQLDESYTLTWQKSAAAVRKDYNLEAWNEVRYRQLLNVVNG